MIDDALLLLTAALGNPHLETVYLFSSDFSLIGKAEDILVNNHPRPFVQDIVWMVHDQHSQRRYSRVEAAT